MSDQKSNVFSGSSVMELMYGKKIETPKVETPKEEIPKDEVKTETAKSKEKVIETPLGNFKAETENPIDIFAKIKEKTELEIKTEDELIEKLNKLKELEGNEGLIKDNVLNKQIRELIGNAPDDLRALLAAYEGKQDYRTLAKTLFVEGIDLSKDVDKIDEFKLVSHYNPDITEDDYEDLDAKAQTALINASRRSFKTDQQQYNVAIQQAETQKNEYAKRVIASVEKSIEKLKKDFPNLKQSQIKEIETRLYQDPTYDLVDTSTRAYREDAATKLAWSLYGNQTLQSVVAGMQSEVNKKIEEGIKQRTSEELELIAQQKGDTVKKMSDTKDPAKEEIVKAKQRVASWLQDSSSGFLNKYDKQPINKQ